MNDILAEYARDALHYMGKAFAFSRPIAVVLITVVNYVIFPTEAHIPAVISLVIALAIDIITKYYAVSVQNGGLKNAVRTRALSSNTLWKGTQRKIISYLVILILAGLSVRVTTITSISVLLSTTALGMMFIRESQSCIENLMDAGHSDLEWILFWIKRKRRDIEVKEIGMPDTMAPETIQERSDEYEI